MAWLKGRGVAAVNYPTGMNLGGDPSQALIHATTTGSFVITLSSRRSRPGHQDGRRPDLRRDARRALRHRDDRHRRHRYRPALHGHLRQPRHAPHRQRHHHGGREAREVMLEVAATELEVDAGDLVTDGKGRIHVKGAPDKGISRARVGACRAFQARQDDLRPRHVPEAEERGRCPRPARWTRIPARRMPARSPRSRSTTRPARSRVLKLTNAYEIGRALNPALAQQQIVGGAWMGISHALYETTEPYYPDRSHGPLDFSRISDAGPGRHRRDGSGHHRAPGRQRPLRRQGHRRDDGQFADPGDRQRHLRRLRRARHVDADHAGKGAARARRAARRPIEIATSKEDEEK